MEDNHGLPVDAGGSLADRSTKPSAGTTGIEGRLTHMTCVLRPLRGFKKKSTFRVLEFGP